MKLIRHLLPDPLFPQGCVLTIGNFDGVHAGHGMILNALREQANKMNLPMLVMCFEPQPIEYFRGADAPARISTARDKINLLSAVGVDALYLVRFDEQLASMSADDFVQLLTQQLHAKFVMIGDDFCFGKNRQGDFDYLKLVGKKCGFSVRQSTSYKIGNRRVSSTLIRHSLEKGELSQAATYLGRTYSMSGRVIHGHKRGRELGFPTANIKVRNRKTPLKGVFAVTISLESGGCFLGVANVGTRPSIEETESVLLEVHLFDFDDDLYGQRVSVDFIEKLRDEKKFNSLDHLTQQITDDAEQARIYFNHQLTSQKA